jgi:hypothetical protein
MIIQITTKINQETMRRATMMIKYLKIEVEEPLEVEDILIEVEELLIEVEELLKEEQVIEEEEQQGEEEDNKIIELYLIILLSISN